MKLTVADHYPTFLNTSANYMLVYQEKERKKQTRHFMNFTAPVRCLNSSFTVKSGRLFLLKGGKLLQSEFNINKYAQNQALQGIKRVLMIAGGAEYRLIKILVGMIQECSRPSDAKGHLRNQQRPNLANCLP